MIIHPVIRSFLYNLFLSEDELNSRIFAEGTMDKNQFVQNGINQV